MVFTPFTSGNTLKPRLYFTEILEMRYVQTRVDNRNNSLQQVCKLTKKERKKERGNEIKVKKDRNTTGKRGRKTEGGRERGKKKGRIQ